MKGRWVRLAGLFLLTATLVGACTPAETVRISPSPSPTAARTTAAPTATATRTPSPTPSATASPSPTSNASPGSTPATACQPVTGGGPITPPPLAVLDDVRAAHHPGYDRLVFEFQGTKVPEYRVEVVNSFQATSGQNVTVSGNAFFQVRFSNSAAHTDAGTPSYTGPNPINAGLPTVRQVRLIEDFEGVVRWGIGLERLACPTVSTLSGPVRIVVDFPAAP